MFKRVIKKQTKKALSFGEKAVLILALVAVTAVVSKAEETPVEREAKLALENAKAIEKLVEDVPTDKELIGDVILAKHVKNPYGKHLIVEPFSCDVALADRAEIKRQLTHSGELSEERRREYSSTLATVVHLIRKNKCEEGK